MDGAVTVAASVAALLLCGPALLAPRVARAPVPGLIRTTIRDRALRTAFLPQRDPDASGRPRPRAPGRLQGRSPHRSGGLGPLRLAAWPSPAL
ncbi:DUF6412 domain-containing protein [Streptomyces sp. NPDC005438]|uniref:DUF6412 domain-containing protein n=1 Tax=Streptomyces sp. NPDC005438 TaxID=3156880 RepID=UPI0033A8F55B